MDNYFNQPITIESVWKANVGSIGTFRRQRAWPPKEYKRVKDNRYNTVYSLEDKRNFLMMRWIDNTEVDMVTTVHDGYETVTKMRKHPRENQNNKSNIRHVWGSDWGVNIDIPQVINDYNCTIGAVDKAYQMISNYKPKLRCRRTWMPMFLHTLDICRLNSYIVCNKKEGCKNQKDFIFNWIESFNMRADLDDRKRTRAAIDAFSTPPAKAPPGKRVRMVKHNVQLSAYRLLGDRKEHVEIIVQTQNSCTYCKYISRAKAKADGVPTNLLRTICRPARQCFACGDHLCQPHFNIFHEQDDE
jgi:hypothetical protein